MAFDVSQICAGLQERGWSVRQTTASTERTPALERYPWLPDDVMGWITICHSVVSSDETAWMVTNAELSETTDTAFSWDQWERDSLSAAEGDSEWRAAIIAFWDEHFPLLLSVKSGYAYLAIRKADLKIVAGEEPEYEETELIADSFEKMLDLLVESDEKLSRWV